jgi:hypothetical protein
LKKMHPMRLSTRRQWPRRAGAIVWGRKLGTIDGYASRRYSHCSCGLRVPLTSLSASSLPAFPQQPRALPRAIKHDGIRVIARKQEKRVKLYSRPGNDLTHRFTSALSFQGSSRESFPANANDPNWVAAMGATDSQRNAKFARKVADLRKTDATVDWSGIEERDGQKRRVAKWLSEL